ncbi:MAG: Nramp family divalent metal transporter [Pseudomonadota bacterium]
MAQAAERGGVWKVLGPGLLFAGAAIGVSHLVQSTRAGAEYGLALILFVLIANLAKYPAFLIGNQYAAATGENLITAYRRQGPVALWVFVAATLATMFAGCAAISITTAALAKATFGLPFDTLHIVIGVWALVGVILYFGQYQALDGIIKVLLAFLTIATLITTALTLPNVSFGGLGDLWPANFDRTTILFIAALVGWMPAPLDTSVWQSLWSQAKERVAQRRATMAEAQFDFNVGFIGTTLLAVCFLLMGAGVMHGSGATFADGSVGFAAQIIDLYESALGPNVAMLVGAAAMAVVFSTTLTAIDAWPRTMAAVAKNIRAADASSDGSLDHAIRHPYYWVAMLILLGGAWGILARMMNSFKTLIDIATTVSFFTAPFFAWLNHRAMFGDHVPAENRPSETIRIWSLAGVTVLALFAVYYLWFRFLT